MWVTDGVNTEENVTLLAVLSFLVSKMENLE